MIMNAAVITFLGMGAVFVFLLIMIAAMDATRMILPYLDRLMPEAAPAAVKKISAARPAAANDAAIALSIAAAYANSGRTL